MKKLILYSSILAALLSCNSRTKSYENVIADFAEENVYPGVKTDLKMKFIESSISDIKVADSIAILEKQFRSKQAEKVESAKKMIEGFQQLSEASYLYKSELEKAEIELKNAESWHPDYLNRYNGRNANEVIAKKVVCKFSYQEPKLTTRQEKEGIFVLSADEKRVIKMVKE